MAVKYTTRNIEIFYGFYNTVLELSLKTNNIWNTFFSHIGRKKFFFESGARDEHFKSSIGSYTVSTGRRRSVAVVVISNIALQ